MKINYYGKRNYTALWAYNIRKFLKSVLIVVLTISIGAIIFLVGAFTFSTSTVEANNITVVAPLHAPVLDRIANCESGNGKKGSATQFRSGQVIVHSNRNGTTDIGKYQINMYIWGKKAGELGYNLSTEQGNTKMAEWIYLNKGTGAWLSSFSCWKR